MIYPVAFQAAKEHARASYPEEMCGFVINGDFVAVRNVAASPSEHVEEDCQCRLCTFEISTEDTLKYFPQAQMILHSHPDGPGYPSQTDMEGQVRSDIPWGLVSLNEEYIGEFEIWGDGLPIAPLVGRTFTHGIRDCYSVIRDAFRLGKDELARLDMTQTWPFEPITLMEIPRVDGWWNSTDDLYSDHFTKVGFIEITREEARPGDCFLCKIRSDKYNHAGMLISNDLIMHHLPSRVSRREPSGIWYRAAGRWLRYVGEQK